MTRLSADALQALKAAHPLDRLIGKAVPLGRASAKGVHAGPCLCHPTKGKSPLWVNADRGSWGCLKGGCGGDIFDYLQQFEGLDFKAAVDFLGGARELDETAAAQARQEREARALARGQAERTRCEIERRRAYDLFRCGRPIAGTPVADYLAKRGLAGFSSPVLAHLANAPYWWLGEGEARPRIIHRGPAMMAAIQGPDDRFIGVHLTWIDPATTTGKAVIVAPDGAPQPAKKMRGGHMTGAVRLVGPSRPALAAGEKPVLVIGEGIETTLSAYLALIRHGRLGGTGYGAWAAGSLGNMSGGGLGPSTRNPNGRGFVPSSEPDPARPGLMAPDWAASVILLGDGDSDPAVTLARLDCARRRHEAAGTPAVVRFAPDGFDFNDLVRAA